MISKTKKMNKRREFITQLGLLAAGVAIAPSFGCMAMPKSKKFGIQLYSLREQLPKGVEDVIAKVAKAGYSYVEGYGYSLENGFWGLTWSLSANGRFKNHSRIY